MALLKQAL